VFFLHICTFSVGLFVKVFQIFTFSFKIQWKTLSVDHLSVLSNETRAQVKSSHFLCVVLNGWAHQFGRIECCEAFRTILYSGTLILCLLFDTLQICTQFGLEWVEASRSTLLGGWCGTSSWVQTGRWSQSTCRLVVIVNALSIDCDVAKWEIEPWRAWLFQVDAQVLQIATFESSIEL